MHIAQCTCTCNAINFSFSLSSRQSEYLEIVSLTLGPWMMATKEAPRRLLLLGGGGSKNIHLGEGGNVGEWGEETRGERGGGR